MTARVLEGGGASDATWDANTRTKGRRGSDSEMEKKNDAAENESPARLGGEKEGIEVTETRRTRGRSWNAVAAAEKIGAHGENLTIAAGQ